MLSSRPIRAALFFALALASLPLHAWQAGSSDKAPPAQAPDSNPFPEDASSKAARQQRNDPDKSDPDKSNQDKSNQDKNDPDKKDAAASATPEPANTGGDQNAFPEEASRKAAADAHAASSTSGVSSSSDYDTRTTGGRNTVEPNAAMPHIRNKDLAKEDVQVGGFYLQSGDFKGAYARFKEASTLRPENTDAIFGLAESARHLAKMDEALDNYRLYLAILPSGSKARDARKALALIAKATR